MAIHRLRKSGGIADLIMLKRRALVAYTAVELLTVIDAGSVSAHESDYSPTTVTIVDHRDEVSGIV